MSRANDGHGFQSVNTTQVFPLIGGEYGIDVTATFDSGTVGLQRLGPDGATWVDVMTAFSAAGYQPAYLAPGQYRLNLPSNTAAATITTDVGTVQTDMTNTDANAVITADNTAKALRVTVDADWTALKAAITAGNWAAAQADAATMLTDVGALLAATAVQGDNTTKTLVTLLQTDTTTLQSLLGGPSAVYAAISRIPGE